MLAAFLLALSTGPFCLLSCTSIVVPVFLSSDIDARRNFRYGMLFLLGRLIGYMLFACVLWIAGLKILPMLQSGIGYLLHALLYIILGLLMVLSGLIYNFPKLKICEILSINKKAREKAVVFGLITGLNLCPPFLTASAQVLSHPNFLQGILFFFVFFIVTSVFFLPFFGIFWIQKRIESIRFISRITLLIIGFYFLIMEGILPVIRMISIQGV